MNQLPNSDKLGNEFSFKCIKMQVMILTISQSESNIGREEFDYFLPFDNQNYENESQISNRSFSLMKSGNQLLAIESPIHKVEEQEDMDDDQFLSQNQISYFTVPGKVMHESIIDQSYRSQFLPKTIEDLSNDKGQRKIRKQGCTCKKRKCSSKYCWCIKNGMACSDLCKCQNCININDQVRKASTSTEKKGCKCKKNNCLKGYCDCFVNGLKCNSNCKCLQCKNILQKQNDSPENKEKIVPKIKKRIKKFSLLYRKGRGFRRTNRKKILIMD